MDKQNRLQNPVLLLIDKNGKVLNSVALSPSGNEEDAYTESYNVADKVKMFYRMAALSRGFSLEVTGTSPTPREAKKEEPRTGPTAISEFWRQCEEEEDCES